MYFLPQDGQTLRHRLAVIAVVTNDHAFAAMIRERDVAVRALDCLAARAAENKARITATVEQDDRLFAAFVCLSNRFEQFVGKHARFAVTHKDVAHVDDARGAIGRAPMRSGKLTSVYFPLRAL